MLTPKRFDRVFLGMCDGYCFNNGEENAQAGTSMLVFDVSALGIHPYPSRNIMLDLKRESAAVINAMRCSMEKQEIGENCQTGRWPRPTNNLAEAVALRQLLHRTFEKEILHPHNFLHVWSDSQLVVNHVLGIFRKNNDQLKRQYNQIDNLTYKYEKKYGKAMWDNVHLKHISGKLMKIGPIGH